DGFGRCVGGLRKRASGRCPLQALHSGVPNSSVEPVAEGRIIEHGLGGEKVHDGTPYLTEVIRILAPEPLNRAYCSAYEFVEITPTPLYDPFLNPLYRLEGRVIHLPVFRFQPVICRKLLSELETFPLWVATLTVA